MPTDRMNREQFIQQVNNCQRALRRFLTALCCGDAQLADDIAQDAFLKAYVSCDGLKDDGKFSSWIYQIAYNTFVSYTRSKKYTFDLAATADIVTQEQPDDNFRYQALYAALDRLSEKERSAILLFYLEGYSIKEIAEITDHSQDAIRQHLSRGRNNLRKYLESQEQ